MGEPAKKEPGILMRIKKPNRACILRFKTSGIRVSGVSRKCWPEGTGFPNFRLVQTSYSSRNVSNLSLKERALTIQPIVRPRAAKPRVRRKQRNASSMSTLHFRRVERRRTTRVTVFADLVVQGTSEENQKFKIRTRSLCVSGHGGQTVLDVPVSVGQTMVLVNDNSGEKAECKVVSVRPGGNGKFIVAFEFVVAPANFWKMSFPPAGARLQRRSMPSEATA